MKLTILPLLLTLLPSLAGATSSPYAPVATHLAEIPILHDGRVKPLDTFARAHLLAFSSKSSLPEMSAIEWLTEALFAPGASARRKVFDIRNPQVLAALSLNPAPEHRYSLAEILPPLMKIRNMLIEVHRREDKEKTPEQKQLIDLFSKAMRHQELTVSFSFLLARVTVSPEIEKAVGLESGVPHRFLEIRRHLQRINQLIDSKAPGLAELTQLRDRVAQLASESNSEVFKVIPLQWAHGGSASADPSMLGEWFSPSALLTNGDGSPDSVRYVQAWQKLGETLLAGGDPAAATTAAQKVAQEARQLTLERASPRLLSLEHKYNEWSLFHKSLGLYVAAFLLILASTIPQLHSFRNMSFVVMLLAFGCHAVGLGMRVAIMGRPPVATLYESVIFVGLVVALLSLVYEWIRRNSLGLIAGSIAAAALHFIALGYAADGDTMGMLVAVLNTNFWLATHVVCITIGYGCSIVAGIMGHIYLIEIIFGNKSKEQRTLLSANMVGASLIALFFTMFGTILGGIWADQSWGRFWGWDPKENGALLIVLWLLMLLHGRISGHLKAISYATGLVLTNVVVALAWFGVNLLNVGLHSYGFTDSIALNLGLFVAAECTLALVGYLWASKKQAATPRKA